MRDIDKIVRKWGGDEEGPVTQRRKSDQEISRKKHSVGGRSCEDRPSYKSKSSYKPSTKA
jgi:hypothetical protein